MGRLSDCTTLLALLKGPSPLPDELGRPTRMSDSPSAAELPPDKNASVPSSLQPVSVPRRSSSTGSSPT